MSPPPIVTLTTVGYGDIAPGTVAGQSIAAVVMVLGYGIIAVPTGIVSVELTHAHLVVDHRNPVLQFTDGSCSTAGNDLRPTRQCPQSPLQLL